MPEARRGTAAVLLLCAACDSVVLGPRPKDVALAVANPDGLDLVLCTMQEGKPLEVAHIGRAAAWGAQVAAGKYWLQEPSLPLAALPLLPDALSARGLRVTVSRPGASDPDWACIPAGPALIGDELGIGQEDERPARVVDVPAFWIARHEVTNARYARFLNECGSPPDPAWLALDSRKCRIAHDAATGRFTTDAPALPVVPVSFTGAAAYCGWLTRASGVVHRLPTELEWEKAARGPASCVYAFGDVYQRGKANAESGALAPVASFTANGWGLFDTTGNAFEWVADRYAAGPDHVLRGGSFVLDGVFLRNSFRMHAKPGTRADDFGFRPVREAAPAGDGEKR